MANFVDATIYLMLFKLLVTDGHIMKLEQPCVRVPWLLQNDSLTSTLLTLSETTLLD